MRYFIEFSYAGSNYHGWQIQPNAITVQEVLEQAMSLVLRTPINLTAAGRTDTGVHAKQMFAHFDHNNDLMSSNLIFKLNSLLPSDIAILDLYYVPEKAHARFDAISRTYNYSIHYRKDPFIHHFSHQIFQQPDIELMNKASEILTTYSNFECFSRTQSDVKTFICKISEAHWIETGEKLIFTITADRFLRNMVRAIVGTLLDIGFKKNNLDHLKSIIESRNRSNAGASAPANGLHLTEVKYPSSYLKRKVI